MKTYFACSDIHGFYDEMMDALTQSGYQKDNPEHILIVCGDVFDRGDKPYEVYRFLRDLPTKRKVLVRGNHEDLLIELLDRGYGLSRDLHNGTLRTLEQLCPGYETKLRKMNLEYHDAYGDPAALQAWREEYAKLDRLIYRNKRIDAVRKWIESDEWVDYYELGRFIFVHAFIPLFTWNDSHMYDPYWRTGTSEEGWKLCRWGCPPDLYRKGLFEEEEKKGKVLVVGHWHTSDFYNLLDYRNKPSQHLPLENNPIYRSSRYPGLIGLDAMTALTHKVNVLVIKEEEIDAKPRSFSPDRN